MWYWTNLILTWSKKWPYTIWKYRLFQKLKFRKITHNNTISSQFFSMLLDQQFAERNMRENPWNKNSQKNTNFKNETLSKACSQNSERENPLTNVWQHVAVARKLSTQGMQKTGMLLGTHLRNNFNSPILEFNSCTLYKWTGLRHQQF